MKYIIDGYNLIHRAGILDRCGGDITRSREKLEHILINYLSARSGVTATIVYDSRNGGGSYGKSPSTKLSLLFASGDADSAINAYIRRNRTRKDIVIVSTDRKDIISTAKGERVKSRSSESFYKMIIRPVSPSQAGPKSLSTSKTSEITNWYKRILEERGRV